MNWSSQSQSQSYGTTDGQSASLSCCQAPIWGLRPDFYYCQTVAGLLMWGALSDERMGLPFTIAAGPCQSSHSRVRVPGDSWSYFTVSDSRLPQPGGPGPRIFIPKEQGGPVLPPGICFPFRRLLRLAGLRWSYSNPPPRGVWSGQLTCPQDNSSARTTSKTSFFYCHLRVRFCGNVFTEPLLRNGYLFIRLLHSNGCIRSLFRHFCLAPGL
jgi:hypothetical protein